MPGLALGLFWVCVVAFALWRVLGYANAPGPAGLPPAHWPTQSQIIPNHRLPTLVMFVHPRCPCSRASIEQLSLLMARCQGRVNAQVVFARPSEMPAGWEKTDTWREASLIPGVFVRSDVGRTEALTFHLETSGDTVLYAPDGTLIYHGGITLSRGHVGENPGWDAVLGLLQGDSTSFKQAPAFGCSIFELDRKGAP